MHKFFVPAAGILADKIIIEDREQTHHIKNVLKLKVGEKVAVFDGSGNEYNCVIRELKNKIYLNIEKKIPADNSPEKVKLTIACAIPKKAKIDDIIDKLVQLGVSRIIPLMTERVVVKLDKPKEALRYERWKKIALSAAKQCKRNSLVVIEPVKDFKDLIKQSREFDLKLIPHLLGDRQSLKEILAGSEASNILVLIGPEGDFSEREVSLAIAAGFIPVTLGDLVLRVDTAAIAAASFIRLYAHH
ncbi:MAG: RsmE family RNA methyltransferase [Candidatus Omnitrophica bacterium]|nr:RsmE family RNA methyltransferase [Candidatus Omnitrophota bacterium]